MSVWFHFLFTSGFVSLPVSSCGCNLQNMATSWSSSISSSIDGETLEKAKRELNEDPETREQAINDMRKPIEEKESEKRERERGSEFILYLHVHSQNSDDPEFEGVVFERKDPQFLLQFLRAKKFNKSRSLSLYLKHYMIRKDNPQIFFEDASPSTLRDILSSGALYVLDGRTHNGEKMRLIMKGINIHKGTPISVTLLVY